MRGPGARPSMDQVTEAPATRKMDATVIPILHMGRLSRSQGNRLAQCTTVRKCGGRV